MWCSDRSRESEGTNELPHLPWHRPQEGGRANGQPAQVSRGFNITFTNLRLLVRHLKPYQPSEAPKFGENISLLEFVNFEYIIFKACVPEMQCIEMDCICATQAHMHNVICCLNMDLETKSQNNFWHYQTHYNWTNPWGPKEMIAHFQLAVCSLVCASSCGAWEN